MSEHMSPIPSMIYNAAVGGHVTNSQQIIDENLNREQNDINQETVGAVPYNSTTPNGMGRIVLKKNDNFKQVVEAQTNGNTIFIIKYDFILTDAVNVPANCVLEFDGGSVSGAYTITGANTGIQAGLVKILNTDVTLAGSWNVTEVYPEWFGAKGDGVTDDTISIQKALTIHNNIENNKGTLIKFQSKPYVITSIELPKGTSIEGIYCRADSEICGTVFYCMDTDNSAIILNSGCKIENVGFFNPANANENIVSISSIVSLPSAIKLKNDANNCLISNITFINSYIGIDEEQKHECLTINNVRGFCLKYCICLNSSYDQDRINNVHMNWNYTYAITNLRNYHVPYRDYAYMYGTLIKYSGVADGTNINGCFAYGYKEGVYLNDSTYPVTITNCAFDACNIGIHLYVGDRTIINDCSFNILNPYPLEVTPQAPMQAIFSEDTKNYSGDEIPTADVIKDCIFRGSSDRMFLLLHYTIVQGCYFYINSGVSSPYAHCQFGYGGIFKNNFVDCTSNANHVVFYNINLSKPSFALEVSNNIFANVAGDIAPWNILAYGNGNKFINVSENADISLTYANLRISGPSSARPNVYLNVFDSFYDTSLGKPIYWNGSAWVDATGARV